MIVTAVLIRIAAVIAWIAVVLATACWSELLWCGGSFLACCCSFLYVGACFLCAVVVFDVFCVVVCLSFICLCVFSDETHACVMDEARFGVCFLVLCLQGGLRRLFPRLWPMVLSACRPLSTCAQPR